MALRDASTKVCRAASLAYTINRLLIEAELCGVFGILCLVANVKVTTPLCHKAACCAGAGAASRDAASKPAHRTSEPPQRPRTQVKAQPHSPPAPTLSASMNPAIHAKLQQAHNKLLAQSTRGYPSRQEDTAGVSARPAACKPASRKGRAAAQPEPPAGMCTRQLSTPAPALTASCTMVLVLTALHIKTLPIYVSPASGHLLCFVNA